MAMNKKKGIIETSILGIGPILFIWTVGYGLVMVYLNYKFSGGLFFLNSLPQYATFAFGDIFLFIGSIIFFKSFLALKESRQKGKLAVEGVYGFMRHPMYAAWIFFIIPGIAVIARSLFFLSVALCAYCVYKYFIKAEEDVLEYQFGQDYIHYKNSAGLLFLNNRR